MIFYFLTGPVKESAVWVDESILVNPVFARKRAASPSQLHPDDPLELSDELNELVCYFRYLSSSFKDILIISQHLEFDIVDSNYHNRQFPTYIPS